MIKFLSFLLLILPYALYAQDEKVELKSFNADLLNECLTKEVNALRKRKRLDTLGFDEILQKAAIDQAEYMAANNVIGNGQKDKRKGSPYKRVLFYGGSHNLIGENVQAYDLEKAITKSKNRLTYARLAKDMVDIWEKSKLDLVNLIEPAFAHVAHQFKLKDGVLFTCQVFGSKPFVEQFAFKKGEAISMREGTECLDCKQVRKKIYNDEVSLGWYTVSNDSIYYWNVNHYRKGRLYNKKKNKYRVTVKRNNLNQVFSANGIITIDLLHNSQFDCGGKPSFHNSPYHNGYYLGYIDKNIIRMNDLNSSPEIVQLFIGMKPEFVDTFFQVDFHLIKKQRPCIQTSTIYVTPDYLKPYEYFSLPTATLNANQELVIEDSVITKIPFERNQTNEDTSIFRPLVTLLDSLVKDDHQIEKIYFTGVASIEGTLKDNRKLITRRGGIIEEYLKRYYPEIPFESNFYENFDDFRSGLVAAGYVDATEISLDTLRMFANDNKFDKEIAEILDQSRFSTVKVVYRDSYKMEEGSYGLSVQRINDLLAEGKISEAVPLYLVMINDVIYGKTEASDELRQLNFPKSKAYAKLNWYQFLFELATTDLQVDAERLNELRTIGAIESDGDYLEFRLLFNLFNENEAIDISDLSIVLESVRDKRQKAWIQCLAIVNEVENYRLTPDAGTDQLMELVLASKFDLKETYFICQYLIQWGNAAEPYVLLSKFARRPNQLPKLYTQYLKLGYFLLQFENEGEWKKIKMVLNNLAENYPNEFCTLVKWDEMGVGSLQKKEIAALFCATCQERANQ